LKPAVDCLLDLNRDYIRAVETSDVSRFAEILADDFLCSQPDGSLLDREAFLRHTAAPVKISNLEAHDVKVRIMGDVAIIHARTTTPYRTDGPERAATRTCGHGGTADGWPSQPTLPVVKVCQPARTVVSGDSLFHPVYRGLSRTNFVIV